MKTFNPKKNDIIVVWSTPDEEAANIEREFICMDNNLFICRHPDPETPDRYLGWAYAKGVLRTRIVQEYRVVVRHPEGQLHISQGSYTSKQAAQVFDNGNYELIKLSMEHREIIEGGD